MKRNFVVLGLLAIASLAIQVTDADAFCCRRNRCGRGNRCETRITCRPYNAFTPICWGNLICDGCCPNPCNAASGCMPQNMCMPCWNPWAMSAMAGYGGCGMNGCAMGWGGYGQMGCGAGGCELRPGATLPDAAPATGTPGPQITPSAATRTSMVYPNNYYGYGMNPYAMNSYGLMRTSYNAGYYPGYNAYPANYYQQAVPYYWYGPLSR